MKGPPGTARDPEDLPDRGSGAAVAGGCSSRPAPRRTRRAEADLAPEFADAWLAGARDGGIRNRSGDATSPRRSAATRALRKRLLPELGAVKLSELRRLDLQRLADELAARRHQRRHHPQHAPAAAGDLPPRPQPQRDQRQPDAAIEMPAARGRRTRSPPRRRRSS